MKFIADLQDLLNHYGADLVTDGIHGPKTQAALEKALAGKLVKASDVPKPAQPVSKSDKSAYFGAPWVGANIDMLGRYETDKELNERYVPEWKLEGLPGYKTLSGNTYAWCSLRHNADRRKVGAKGTNSAAASSWSKWGKKCPFWFGATLDIQHKSGGRHVCEFLYWIDERKKIAATLDGNRSNQFGVFETDLSGKGDTLVTGPRWQSDWPDGCEVSMGDVLKMYPHLKVGSKGNTTR